MRPKVRRVAATDSCWPATWNSSANGRGRLAHQERNHFGDRLGSDGVRQDVFGE